jgi:prepilin-type N-terminal cleavage/methylation domain-containing protein
MKNPVRNKNGFTLLELILSMALLAVIVTMVMAGLRLGIQSQEAGESAVESRQRLRIISLQLAQKIKSTYPVFITPINRSTLGEDEKIVTQPASLAFEGGKDFIRLLTFASTLTETGSALRPHEVKFFLGEHPDTRKKGILMTERDLSNEEPFSRINTRAGNVRTILLAENVSSLKFRYYQMEKFIDAEFPEEKNETVAGRWVDTIRFLSPEFMTPTSTIAEDNASEKETGLPLALPRGVEVVLGWTDPLADDEQEKIIHSPPIIIPLHSGMKFTLPEVEEEEDDASS